MKTDTTKIHLVWALCTLITFIIWNFSLNWGNQKEFTGSISLAFGLASLIVGVYAIFQGLASNSIASETSVNLRSSAERVTEAASRVEAASQTLTSRVDVLPSHLSSLQRSVDELATKQQAATSVATGEAPALPADPSAFRGPVTNGGLLSLYMCIQAEKTGKPFNPRSIIPEGDIAHHYIDGFLHALRYTNFIDVEKEGKSFIIKDLKSVSEAWVNGRIKSYNKDDLHQYFRTRVPLIDDYFTPEP